MIKVDLSELLRAQYSLQDWLALVNCVSSRIETCVERLAESRTSMPEAIAALERQRRQIQLREEELRRLIVALERIAEMYRRCEQSNVANAAGTRRTQPVAPVAGSGNLLELHAIGRGLNSAQTVKQEAAVRCYDEVIAALLRTDEGREVCEI